MRLTGSITGHNRHVSRPDVDDRPVEADVDQDPLSPLLERRPDCTHDDVRIAGKSLVFLADLDEDDIGKLDR